MSNYIGKRGYILKKDSLTEDEIEKIRLNLDVKPNISTDFGEQIESFKVYLENDKKLYIPKFYGYELFGRPDINKIPDGEDIDLKFNGNLRELQKNAVNAYINSYKKDDIFGGGIISLGCGQGKTVVALNIIHRMKKKTLVVVHKEFLMNQWIERIGMFLPDARIGIIQQNKYDVDKKDIVICMLQTIAMRTFTLYQFDCFGLVIIDEAHRVPSRVFSRALSKINSKYMLALSATPNRKDGLTKVLKWFVGPIIFSTNKKNDYQVEVERYKIISLDDYYNEVLLTYNGKVKVATMINNICSYEKRNNLILEIIDRILGEHEERQILILSDRKNQLKYFYNIAVEKNKYSVGYYIGGMSQKELKKSEDCRLILATFPMANEGLDIPNLNSLILASPKSDIIQSAGRVLRKKHENFLPKIVDIYDVFSIFESQGVKRFKFYKKNKYNINEFVYDCNKKEVLKISNEAETSNIEKETKKNMKIKNIFK